MKDEIDKIKKCLIAGYDLDIITQEEMGIFWNCITNSQEENEKLKDYLDIFKLSNKTKQETIDDFRKRVDKAIEYITSEETINMFSSINAREKWLKINHKLLNILNGDK